MSQNPNAEPQFSAESTESTTGSSGSSGSTIGKWLSILLPVALGGFLIWYSFSQFTSAQIEEIKGYFKNANYTYIFIAILISILGNMSRAYRWKFALNHMGYTSSFPNNFMAINIGYLLNLTVPKSGEISRAVIVRKYNGIPFDKGFGTIVAERIVDLIILLLFMLLALVLQFDIAKAFILDKIPVNKLVILAIAGVFASTVVILVYLYSKNPIILKLKKQVSGLKEGVLSIVHMEKKWAYFGHTLLIWLSFILTFYVTIFTFNETSTLSFGAVVTSFVVGSIAIAFTNSGFGSYPFLISKILLFYAISETVGNAFGWIVWTSQMIMTLVVGLLSFLLLPVFNRKK